MGGRVARIPDCHPERRHEAHGLCKRCYRQSPAVRAQELPKMRARSAMAYCTTPPEKRRVAQSKYRSSNRERINASHSAWRAKRPLHSRNERLKHFYKITVEDYDRMFVEQGGVCKVCSSPPPSGKPLDIDHDHITMEIRGLLCGPCNRAAGMAKDSPARLRALADYLEAAASRKVAA